MTALTPPTDAELKELLKFGTATLYEASGLDCDLDPGLRPVWPGARVAGTALPVRTASGDNLPLHHAVAAARPGEVLVVDGRGAACGYWGEVLTVAAQAMGIAGLVIDGGVRDVARLAGLGFPVFSTSVAVQRTAKKDPGSVGDRVQVAGRPVARGDIVVADEDGVVVFPAARLSAVRAEAQTRVDKETAYLERIRAGALTVDLYGLRR